MKIDFAIVLSILLAVLFIGTIGAFLLYVPVLTVFTVVVMITGLGLMFALGLLIGARWRRFSVFAHSHATPIRKLPGNLYVVR